MIASRLRSRQTSWSVGSAPASWANRVPATADRWGEAVGLSVDVADQPTGGVAHRGPAPGAGRDDLTGQDELAGVEQRREAAAGRAHPP